MDNKVTLTIQSTSGSLTDEFNTNQPLHAVKRQAMARLEIDPSQADSYQLVHDNNMLDESQTLEDLNIPDGATLLLVLKSAVVV